MNSLLSRSCSTLVMAVALIGCGGGDGGTPPVTVASVVITAPAAAPSFATLGRTAQFSAEARTAAGAAIPGAVITWSTSTAASASVSGTGLVTAVANGTTQIRATSGGIQSNPVTVTVAQLAANVVITPGAVAMGAIGSTRQLTAAITDTGGAVVAGLAPATFARVGAGTSATVSLTGLVTATAVGNVDTAVATSGTITAKAPITVTQVVRTVTVTSTVATPDTLFAATRTRQFTAAATDTNSNAIPGVVFAWQSSAAGVATVNATSGLVTAVSDGSANIQASASGVNATRAMLVRRLVASKLLGFTGSTITTAGGTLQLSGTANDSSGAPIPITWVSRTTAVATVNAAGLVTATGNGSSVIAFTVPTLLTGVDSMTVTVSNQPVAPAAITIQVGDTFFRSDRNNTQNQAIDTVAVGGQVTWNWVGALPHQVQSTGTPTFPNSSSISQTTGSYVFNFPSAGTFTYNCSVHGAAMTGRVVVR